MRFGKENAFPFLNNCLKSDCWNGGTWVWTSTPFFLRPARSQMSSSLAYNSHMPSFLKPLLTSPQFLLQRDCTNMLFTSSKSGAKAAQHARVHVLFFVLFFVSKATPVRSGYIAVLYIMLLVPEHRHTYVIIPTYLKPASTEKVKK